MPNENPVMQETATPEVAEPQLTPAEMFLQDMNAAEAETPMAEVGANEYPEVQAAEEAMGMPAAEAPVAEGEAQAMPAPDNGELQQMRSTIASLLDIVKQNQAEKAALAAQASQAEPPQEEAAVVVEEEEPFDEEAFNDEFYANPSASIMKIAQRIADKNVSERLAGLQEELRPLLDESKAAQHRESVKRALGEFLDSTPDGNDYFEDIARYVNDNNLSTDDPRSYRDAYMASKLNAQDRLINELRQANADGSRSLDDYLADDEAVTRIIANDNVKSKVIENYLKELQEGGRPATISSGGTLAGNPPRTAANMEEAGSFLLGDLKR